MKSLMLCYFFGCILQYGCNKNEDDMNSILNENHAVFVVLKVVMVVHTMTLYNIFRITTIRYRLVVMVVHPMTLCNIFRITTSGDGCASYDTM